MKININIKSRRRPGGYALLLLILILCAASVLVLSGNMARTTTVATLNMRSSQFSVLNNAAEAATEKVYSLMAHDFAAYGAGYVSNSLSSYATNYPNANDNAYFANFVYSDAQGHTNKTYVTLLTNYTGPLPTQYTNQFATTSPIYRIISNVTEPSSNAKITGTAQEDMLLACLPITTYAIFYNGELEFSDCATMTVNGRVHSNADICTGAGSSASLTFNGAVTCSSTLAWPERGGITYGSTYPGQGTVFNSTTATDVVSVQISIPMTNTHTIIDIPPAGESLSSAVAQQREYNKAQVVLIVTNSPHGGSPEVMLTLQTSQNGSLPGASGVPPIVMTNCTPVYLLTNTIAQLPFLSLTNTFTDQRESPSGSGSGNNMFVTQIDVGAYAGWLKTNATLHSYNLNNGSGNFATILYVADMRYVGTIKLAVVRLTDAQELPPNTTSGGLNLGFSVASHNPLYVWGNYNTTVDGVHFALTEGSTTNGYSVPAALFSDAVTILSSSWSDSKSSGALSSRTVSANMVMNAAIITGNMPSTGTSATTFSGGVHNLTRMLENWSSVTLTYNTSIVCLYTSQMATNQFQMPGTYYDPPTRVWGFDPTFYNINDQPPGVPVALIPIRYNWLLPTPNSLTSSL